jgi:hypothetical protein
LPEPIEIKISKKVLPSGGLFVWEKKEKEMIIMKTGATQEQIDNVMREIAKYGFRGDVSQGEYKTIIGLIGDERKAPFEHFAALSGVKEAIPV